MPPVSNFHTGLVEQERRIDAEALRLLMSKRLNIETPKKVENTGNFHAGDVPQEGETNFHAGNFHTGNFHAGAVEVEGKDNFHAGNFHAGNFHAGNFHAGNFHAGDTQGEGRDNFHSGNFHVGDVPREGGDNFHAGNFHTGNFHSGDVSQNFHNGNFHAGNFHAGNFHTGNFHAGNFHNGSFHNGSFHTGNFHSGELRSANFHNGNFHAGIPRSLPTTSTKQPEVPSEKPSTGSITVPLTFYVPPSDPNAIPYNYVQPPPDGGPSFNFRSAIHDVPLKDIRPEVSSYTCDTYSFQILQNLDFGAIDWHSETSIKSSFYPQLQSLLCSQLNAEEVMIFDHTIRRRDQKKGPVVRTHVDQSEWSATSRVHRHLPTRAPELLKGRVRLINFWLPLNGAVVSHPLCFADTRTVKNNELIDVEHRYPEWTGATLGVKYGEGQEWYYCSEVKGDEAVLLMCFDTETKGRCAHTAFVDPATKKGWKARESIEVRCLLFG